MTRTILLTAAILCALFAGMAHAADISGNWSGTIDMGGNNFDIKYAFKQEGEKLTGTVTGPSGDMPLKDGKVSGDKVSFYILVDMGGNETKFASQGVIKGDEITLTTKAEGMPDFDSPPMVLKRVK
jgi:hypothetical protein